MSHYQYLLLPSFNPPGRLDNFEKYTTYLAHFGSLLQVGESVIYAVPEYAVNSYTVSLIGLET